MDTDGEFLPHGAVIAIACAVTLITTAIITFILTCIIIKRCCNPSKHSSLRMSYESVWPLSYTAKRTDLEMQQNPVCITNPQVVMETNIAAND